MRKFKIVTFFILCVAIASLFAVEIFAAVYLNVRLTGTVKYRATDIGAKIWGTKELKEDGLDGTSSYLTLSGEGVFSEDIYYISGEESSYTNITASLGTTSFTSTSDSVEIFVFIKNVSYRYIIPNVSVETSNSNIVTEESCYYFDLSMGHEDPLQLKISSSTATEFLNSIDSEINSSNYSSFESNSSMDNEDVFCLKVVVKLSDSVESGGSVQVSSEIVINIGFMADVQYESNDILSVYQLENQLDAEWVKYGYNATLESNATKIEENNILNLELYLRQSDSNGNANYGITQGGYTLSTGNAGLMFFNVEFGIGYNRMNIGFRQALIM